MTIRINANLFRAASVCVSAEEPRYYLNGVLVEPHPVAGILLVATDGHRMAVIHDETGHCDAPAIVRLGKAALKECKPAARGELRREIIVDPDALGADGFAGRADILAYQLAHGEMDGDKPEEGRPVSLQVGCVIDGTFPDWRMVLPRMDSEQRIADCFNGSYVADMAKLGDILAETANPGMRRSGQPVTIHSAETGAPALVRWPGIDTAFAVLMPLRGDNPGTLPAFVNARPPYAEAAE